MVQIRPRRAAPSEGTPLASAPVPARVPGGIGAVSVDGRVTRQFEGAVHASGGTAAELRSYPADGEEGFRAAVDNVGRAGLARAAEDAGMPRSRSTYGRWHRQGRLPRDPAYQDIQWRLERRALVARTGGVEKAAEIIGTSAATVSRWQTGQTDDMTGTRGHGLRRLIAADAMNRAGLTYGDRASFRIRATLEYRALGHTSDDYREERDLTIPTSGGGMPAQFSADLAAALATGDDATAAALIEAAISADFGLGYDDNTGVHIVDLHLIEITWN